MFYVHLFELNQKGMLEIFNIPLDFITILIFNSIGYLVTMR